MALRGDYAPDPGVRVKGVCVVKPIVYGNIARQFGKKREEDGHTHQWTVYVKPYLNEDMSSYVKKVHFKLHESYTEPNRIVTKPPYQVTETGWGEFEIVIKIYFHDASERPTVRVTLYHVLKLFQPGVDPLETCDPITSESYDEIIFQDPTALMQHLLTNTRPLTQGMWKHDTQFEAKKVKTLESILEAKKKIRDKIQEVKERLKLAKEAINTYKTELSQSGSSSAGGGGEGCQPRSSV